MHYQWNHQQKLQSYLYADKYYPITIKYTDNTVDQTPIVINQDGVITNTFLGRVHQKRLEKVFKPLLKAGWLVSLTCKVSINMLSAGRNEGSYLELQWCI